MTYTIQRLYRSLNASTDVRLGTEFYLCTKKLPASSAESQGSMQYTGHGHADQHARHFETDEIRSKWFCNWIKLTTAWKEGNINESIQMLTHCWAGQI